MGPSPDPDRALRRRPFGPYRRAVNDDADDHGLLELAVSVVLLVGFVMLPIWVYRRLIGRGSATHTRSGGATAAQ